MPIHIVLDAHRNIEMRYAQRANEYNYSAALQVGISQAKEGQEIRAEDFQPYRIEKDADWFEVEFIRELLRQSESGELPMPMVADLENSGLLPRIRSKLK